MRMMPKINHLLKSAILIVIAVALLSSAFVLTGQEARRASQSSDVMLAMRDGVKLATSVYLPEGNGPWPVIVTRTPYSKAPYAQRASRYTSVGYVYVTQDMRGRFKSEGSYEPISNRYGRRLRHD